MGSVCCGSSRAVLSSSSTSSSPSPSPPSPPSPPSSPLRAPDARISVGAYLVYAAPGEDDSLRLQQGSTSNSACPRLGQGREGRGSGCAGARVQISRCSRAALRNGPRREILSAAPLVAVTVAVKDGCESRARVRASRMM